MRTTPESADWELLNLGARADYEEAVERERHY